MVITIILRNSLLLPSWMGRDIKTDYACTIIQNTPLSPYAGSLKYVVAHFSQFTSRASCNGIRPFPRWEATRDKKGGQKEHRNQENMAAINSIIYVCTDSPLLPIFSAFSRCHHRHPSAAQGHLHNIHQTLRLSTPYTCSTYFCYYALLTVWCSSILFKGNINHLNTLDLLYLPTPSPFEHFYHHFIPNTIHSWHSHQTSQTLLVWEEHSLSFSQHF